MIGTRGRQTRPQRSSPSHRAGRGSILNTIFVITMSFCRLMLSQVTTGCSAQSVKGRPLTEAACRAHAWRKIHDVYISTQTATAEEVLKRIGELYAVEEEIRGLPATERLAARRTRSKLVLISLHDWLVDKRATLSKKSRPGEAFAYVLNQWDALCYYCDDGLAEPDNNAAERALRAVCPGKKNYIFFGSDHGGERGALLYGLIGTCRLNGIDPEAYLRHILRVLLEWPLNKVAELLPWNVALTNK